MISNTVIRTSDDVTAAWLGKVLGQDVRDFRIRSGSANWSSQMIIEAQLSNGTIRPPRLKVCLGRTFGRSELDYYTRDYVDMPDAPLVSCLDAQFDPTVGYHLLLEDLASTHRDRKDAVPSLEYGIAVADALGRMHRFHWESRPALHDTTLDRYFNEVRPGVAGMEQATGRSMRQRFQRHEKAFRERWSNPVGMSLLHGDLNSTNLLTPRNAEAPVYFLDRQPFDWSLTYGVAVSDLAYFMILWWPEQSRRDCELAVLRQWHKSVDAPDYSWDQAKADWRLSVEQCLNVPFEWCSKAASLDRMRWLWEIQLARVEDAMSQPCSDG
ncbi:MAG: hypothetical protein RIQ60_1881 [Pseudomonadota bacterium]|jgi:hypothetical protein